jgi:hypothetical protein
MKWSLLFIACLSVACLSDPGIKPVPENIRTTVADSVLPNILDSGNTVETRFPVPDGFTRTTTDSTSFEVWLRRLPLHPDGYPVHLFDGRLKSRSDVHSAVLNLDVGRRDLQQCADAVIRLRAEYLYSQKRYADIHFRFTNGFVAEYDRWRRGARIRVEGSRVYWTDGGKVSDAYPEFRRYLDMVFAYSGSASLERELYAVEPTALQPGDVWIKGGYPGHAVMVLDVAVHPQSKERRFLLAQSYMPAQEIHVLKNPAKNDSSPWYSVAESGEILETPEWTFKKNQLRRFR